MQTEEYIIPKIKAIEGKLDKINDKVVYDVAVKAINSLLKKLATSNPNQVITYEQILENRKAKDEQRLAVKEKEFQELLREFNVSETAQPQEDEDDLEELLDAINLLIDVTKKQSELSELLEMKEYVTLLISLKTNENKN